MCIVIITPKVPVDLFMIQIALQAYFSSPVPSQSRVFQALLAELESAEPSLKSLEATMLSYLNEAILIAEEQSVTLFSCSR